VYEREGDDVDETVLNYAEVKALAVGNPLIKKKVEITNEIDQLRILQRDFIVSRQEKERELSDIPAKIEKEKKRIADTEKDMEYYDENKVDYKSMEYEEQKEIRELIFAAVKTHINKPIEKKVLTYQGFDVVVPARMIPKKQNTKFNEEEKKLKEDIPYVFVKRNGVYYMEIESMQGITKRLNNLLEDLSKEKKRREDGLETLLNKKAALENELASNDNSYAEGIEKLAEELDYINKQLGVAA
jgi:chromosome segregation ATPase